MDYLSQQKEFSLKNNQCGFKKKNIRSPFLHKQDCAIIMKRTIQSHKQMKLAYK